MFNKKNLIAKRVFALLTFGVPISCAVAYAEMEDDLSPPQARVELPETYADIQIPTSNRASYDFHGDVLTDRVDGKLGVSGFGSFQLTSMGRLWVRGSAMKAFEGYPLSSFRGVGIGYRHLIPGDYLNQDKFFGGYGQIVWDGKSLQQKRLHVGGEAATENFQYTLDGHCLLSPASDGDATSGASFKLSTHHMQKMRRFGRINVIGSAAYTNIKSDDKAAIRIGPGARWEFSHVALEGQYLYDTKEGWVGDYAIRLSLSKHDSTASYAQDRMYQVPQTYYAQYSAPQAQKADGTNQPKDGEQGRSDGVQTPDNDLPPAKINSPVNNQEVDEASRVALPEEPDNKPATNTLGKSAELQPTSTIDKEAPTVEVNGQASNEGLDEAKKAASTASSDNSVSEKADDASDGEDNTQGTQKKPSKGEEASQEDKLSAIAGKATKVGGKRIPVPNNPRETHKK